MSGSNAPNGSPARGSPVAPSPATRMAGSSPSTVTIAAVRPISMGVRGAEILDTEVLGTELMGPIIASAREDILTVVPGAIYDRQYQIR